MNLRLYLFSLLYVLVVSTVLLTPARAQTAEHLYQEGLAAYNRAEFNVSIELLQKARARTQDDKLIGAIHMQLGINYAVLGNTEAATEAFRGALLCNPELQLDPEQVKASLVALFRETRRALRGALVVDCTAAEIWVDGTRLGPCPARTILPVGRHTLVVKAGSAQRSAQVVVWANRTVRWAVHLPSPAALQKPASSPQPKSHVDKEETVAAVPRAAPTKRKPRLWTWIAGGTGLVTLGVAVGFAVGYRAVEGEVLDQLSDLPPAQYKELVDKRDHRYNIFLGCTIAGTTLLAGAVALFFLEGHRPSATDHRAQRSPQWQIYPLAGVVNGLLLEGRY